MAKNPTAAHVSTMKTPESFWEVATRTPCPSLRGYVRDMYGYTESATTVIRRREFPGPQVVVIFEFGTPVRLYGADERDGSTFDGGFVAGVHSRSTLTEHDGSQRGLQVNFTPLGARLFLGLPMSELSGQVASLADLLPSVYKNLSLRLESLPNWDARFDLVEHVVATRIHKERDVRDLPSQCIAWACGQIEASGGAVDMQGLSRELGYSQKHVIRLFKDLVGVRPKLLARLTRFDRLMNQIKRGDIKSWAELALDCGYYDQSHLNREVRQFAGMTPTQARATAIDLTDTRE